MKENRINATKALGNSKDEARIKKAVEVIKKADKIYDKYDGLNIKKLSALVTKNKVKASKSKKSMVDALYDAEIKKLGWK